MVKAISITPVLNVSSIVDTFTWFEALGWERGFEWGEPVGFGAVCSGNCEIFLCLDGQGGRGKGSNVTTFTNAIDEKQDKGVWLSVFVENVDKLHQICLEKNIEVTHSPSDMPWGVRELHVRHPDGHVLRLSQEL